jgi:hypothetical protein
MVRRLLATLILMAAAGALIPVAATAAGAAMAAGPEPQQFGLRLVGVPASAARDPRALRYIVGFVRPGTVIRRRILIVNGERRRSRFAIYPDAATITHGEFIGAAGKTRNELTSWIRLSRWSMRLRGQSSAKVLVTIRVPKVETHGEHYGVIWVQQTARVRSRTGVAINEVNRVGIRIYLGVGHGVPPTKYAATSITGSRTSTGQPQLIVRVRNTGGQAVDVDGTARLTAGPGGSSAGPFMAQNVIALAPAQSGEVLFAPSRHLPDGPWRASVSLVSGLDKESGSATVVFSASGAGGGWLRLTLLALSLIVGIALLALITTRLRRTRRLATRAPA